MSAGGVGVAPTASELSSRERGTHPTKRIQNMKMTRNEVTDDELQMIYRALCALLNESRDGKSYFHNADRGHPVYRAAADAKEGIADYADGAGQNPLYRLGHALHNEICKRTPVTEFPTFFSSWEVFCEAAVEAYDKGLDAPAG